MENKLKDAIETVSQQPVSLAQKKYELEKQVEGMRAELNKVPRNQLINMYIACLNESIKLSVACENLAKQISNLTPKKESKEEKNETND